MTADELIAKMTGDPSDPFEYEDIVKAMITFARYHVKEALKAALEDSPTGSSTDITSYEDMKDAIINAYPLEKIK